MSLIVAGCTPEGNFIAGDSLGSIDRDWAIPGERKVVRTDAGVIIGFSEGADNGKQIVNDLRNRMEFEVSAMSWAHVVHQELIKRENIPEINFTFVDETCKKPIFLRPGNSFITGRLAWIEPCESNGDFYASGNSMLTAVLFHYIRPPKMTLLNSAAMAALFIEMTSLYAKNVNQNYFITFSGRELRFPSVPDIATEAARIKKSLKENIW